MTPTAKWENSQASPRILEGLEVYEIYQIQRKTSHVGHVSPLKIKNDEKFT